MQIHYQRKRGTHSARCSLRINDEVRGNTVHVSQIQAETNGDLRNNRIPGAQTRTLQHRTSAVKYEQQEQHGACGQGNRLERSEVQAHVSVDAPGNEHDQRRNKQRDLNCRPNGHSEGEIHLLARCK